MPSAGEPRPAAATPEETAAAPKIKLSTAGGNHPSRKRSKDLAVW